MKCSICGFQNDADAEFCENCGNTLAQICPHCRSPLKPGASFCKKCGTPVRPPYPAADTQERLAELQKSIPHELKEKIRISSAQMEGERKPVTILFTDIVGSTSFAEKLDPEEWKEIVSGAHQRVSQAVYRYEGTIAQLLGDGVLAFFGAPVIHEDDPIRAVNAALDIQQSIFQYACDLKGCVDNFQMRIGINTGLVVVGNVGSDMHMEYLAIGDAVNLAARLQSAAHPGGNLISENTARLIKTAFELRPQGEISVKGKAVSVTAFEALKRKAVPESRYGFEELSSPLVGREEELKVMQSALDALANGHGQIVSITGEAGIGKSRLMEEARKRAGRECQGLRWIEGRALSYGQTLSFWAITQLLYSELDLSDGDPEFRVRAALKKHVNELFGEKAVEVLPYLGILLGINLEENLIDHVRLLDGETLKHQTMLSVCRYFQRLAEKQPVVMVFDDLHWADPSSLETLGQLLSITDRAPLMLILLSRLEREHDSWNVKLKAETDYAHRYTEILLRPLSATEQNLLVDNLLAVTDFPGSVRRLILERAEGNPFYLEEIIRSLIEQEAIIRDGEGWKAAKEIDSIAIPETLQGVLLARIDRLQEDVRHTLQLASVIGKSFLYRLLEAIDEAEHQLEEHISLLQRVDLVREKNRQPELEYMFKHSLTQEAAYNSLLINRRREFHQRVGEALEQLFADRKEQFLGLLAYHFEQAGVLEKAVDYLTRAGDQARLTDEHLEAIGYYQRAIALLSSLADQERAANVWLKLGLIYHANFQFDDAHQAIETAFSLRQKSKRPDTTTIEKKHFPFRISIKHPHVTLDPGRSVWSHDQAVVHALFSGLVRLDKEFNIMPEVARSWQVMDKGKRYIFYLREDWFWTDGMPVTAADFEWAWKRNLNPSLHAETAPFLFDIVGAYDYFQGITPSPDKIGVRAIDTHTLEVQLTEPVAFFPFIMTLPITFPLPRKVVETVGEEWWEPDHIVSNGAYRLVDFRLEDGGVMVRNPKYPDKLELAVQRVEWKVIPENARMLQTYQDNQYDVAQIFVESYVPGAIPKAEIAKQNGLGTYFAVFNPTIPPFNDSRVRVALASSVDRKRLFDRFGVPISRGGLIPPGLPGNSPEIGYPFDIEKARSLLKEAGFPGGKGFPKVKGYCPKGRLELYEDFTAQWKENLGIDVIFDVYPPLDMREWLKRCKHLQLVVNGWSADYPDPDNFVRRSTANSNLLAMGWKDEAFDQLVEEASRTSDRDKRMAMYRQADRKLIVDNALILVVGYDNGLIVHLVKPWVKRYGSNPIMMVDIRDIYIEDH